MSLAVEEVAEVTPELVEAMTRMLPQLSKSAPPPTAESLAPVVESPACHLLVARDSADGTIIGTLTLVMFPIPTGVRAWIEDVIADFPRAKGLGVGTALMEDAVRRARAAGARTLDLTSAPRREHANALYQRLGFERRETNVYRKVLETE